MSGLSTGGEHGMDTGRTDPADIRLVRLLPYSGPERTPDTDNRLVTPMDTADVRETLEEEGMDAI
jgi:hypothetical protein